MNMEYKEPVFKVVKTSLQDVLTSSWAPEYTPGTFESEAVPLD